MASAPANYVYYAFWNADTISTYFTYVKMVTGDASFNGLTKSVAILGMLMVTTAAMLRNRVEELGAWLAGLTLFWTIMLVPKVNIAVYDVRTGVSTQVSSVSMGLAFFSTKLSHVGYWLTTEYETVFQSTTASGVDKFSKFGLAGPQRTLAGIQAAAMATPGYSESLDDFVTQCVIPEFSDQPEVMDTISASTDPWTTIKDLLNPARYVQMPLTADGSAYTGAGMDCPTAWTALDTAFANIQNDLLVKVGTATMSDSLRGLPDTATKASLVSQALGDSLTLMTSSAQTTTQVLKNVLLASTLGANKITADGVNSTWSVAVANQSAAINYSTMARIAETTLPTLRSGIEALTIAIFPIVILVVSLSPAAAANVVRTYILIMAWVQLWPPLYAVINSMSVLADESKFNAAVAAFGGTTPQAMSWIAVMGPDAAQMSGVMALSVPVIAWMLIKGGEHAVSQMTSTVMKPSESSASSTASSLAQGNVGAGNVQWSNVSAMNSSVNNSQLDNMSARQTSAGRKVDLSGSYASSSLSRVSNQDGTITVGSQTGSSGKVLGVSTWDGSTLASTTAATGASTTATAQYQRAVQAVQTATATFGERVQGALTSLQGLTQQGSHGTEGGLSRGLSMSSNIGQSLKAAATALQEDATAYAATSNKSWTASGQIGGGVSTGGPPGASANVSAGMQGVIANENRSSASQRGTHQKAFEDAIQSAMQALTKLEGGTKDSATLAAIKSTQGQLQQARDAGKQLSTSVQDAESASTTLTAQRSANMESRVADGSPGLTQVNARGGTPAERVAAQLEAQRGHVGAAAAQQAPASPSGDYRTLSSSVSMPASPGVSPDALKSQGGKAVEDTYRGGRAQAVDFGNGAQSSVSSSQVEAGITPDNPQAGSMADGASNASGGVAGQVAQQSGVQQLFTKAHSSVSAAARKMADAHVTDTAKNMRMDADTLSNYVNAAQASYGSMTPQQQAQVERQMKAIEFLGSPEAATAPRAQVQAATRQIENALSVQHYDEKRPTLNTPQPGVTRGGPMHGVKPGT